MHSVLFVSAFCVLLRMSASKAVIETRCNSELKKAWKMIDDGIRDVFIPYCDEDGYYLPMQIYYNKYSEDVDGFCTDKYGNQLSDAVPRRVLVCPPPVLTKCQTERLAAEERAETNIGVYIPQCEVNGDYKPLQQSASTGSSWCVDKDGKVLDVPISKCQRAD